MEYDDEKLLSLQQYKQMALAYANALKKQGFLILQLNPESQQQLANQVLSTMEAQRSTLFALGGFLGTRALYNLNDKQFDQVCKMFDIAPSHNTARPVHYDKTKLFLSAISLEGKVTHFLIDLALSCPQTEEILQLIKQRADLCSALFSVNSIISSFLQ